MCPTPTRFQLAEIGSLLADPSRAAILLALADGCARPAGELARLAGVAPSTASGHLKRLLDGGVLRMVTQGRHRYFRVADDAVAQVLEALPLLQPARHADVPRGARPLVYARHCYRHLAGRLGVALHDCLRERGWIELGEQALHLTAAGADALRDAGLLPAGVSPRALHGCQCLDWTERRWHLGGALGVGITRHLLDNDWLRASAGSRALTLTPPGRAGLRRLGVVVD